MFLNAKICSIFPSSGNESSLEHLTQFLNVLHQILNK